MTLRLAPKTKLFGEFMIAGLVVWGANLSFTSVQFLGLGSIAFPIWLGFALSCLWIVGMANAINLIDGLDGLASGITLFGLLAVSVVGYLAGISAVTWMSTLLIGCLLGFLVYNSRPASIFLGDCGSLTLGYLAGCLTLLASFREGGVLDGIFPVLAFAIPILDCVFAIFRRTMRGEVTFLSRYGTLPPPFDGKGVISWKGCTCNVGHGIFLFASCHCRCLWQRRSIVCDFRVFRTWRLHSLTLPRVLPI